MELRQLRYFVRTAELESITKAAESLHTSQPSMSRQLAALSREVGAALLQRSSTGVSLTSAGREFWHGAEAILRLIDELPGRARQAAVGTVSVRVGIPSGLPKAWFADAIDQLKVAEPHIALALTEATTDRQRLQLQHGELDIALIHVPAPEAAHRELLTQPYGVAVPPSSPLATADSVTLDVLSDGRWLTHSAPGRADDTHLRETADAHGITVDWELYSFTESLALVAAATDVAGAVLTRESSVSRLRGWAWIPLRDMDISGRRLAVRTWAAWRSPFSPAAQVVLRTLSKTVFDQSDADRPYRPATRTHL
ncbi:LysR family transcriptional regulator [Branchiibius cervicis]|uniref:LysR family transcriptional regulator n=1 Tax=Branchiibius cervicis TaxID=908252 RepID=A0ABW2AT00_9MICO